MSTTTPTLRALELHEAISKFDAADKGSAREMEAADEMAGAAMWLLREHADLAAALRALSNYAGNGPGGHPCHTARALLARLDAEATP